MEIIINEINVNEICLSNDERFPERSIGIIINMMDAMIVKNENVNVNVDFLRYSNCMDITDKNSMSAIMIDSAPNSSSINRSALLLVPTFNKDTRNHIRSDTKETAKAYPIILAIFVV